MSRVPVKVSAEEAIQKLKEGNQRYLNTQKAIGDISLERRIKTMREGQEPYAIIITCSDARVIPDAIFSSGIGDLFIIRVAGNVIDDHQLGSVEYAASHLGCELVVVLGHTHCGAVEAAIHHDPEGYIRYITDEIKTAIGDETDSHKACCLNVEYSMEKIEHSLEIQKMEKFRGLKVVGAIYYLEDGRVEFME